MDAGGRATHGAVAKKKFCGFKVDSKNKRGLVNRVEFPGQVRAGGEFAAGLFRFAFPGWLNSRNLQGAD